MTGISVIIPSYNRASMLGQALESVAAQSLPCDEIIVVDDGSKDNTRELIEGFSSQCRTPLHYIFQENKGPARARNIGIAVARFPKIAFLDSDDHWQKNKLELQAAAMDKKPGFLISHTGERWLRRGEHLNQKKIHQPMEGDIFRQCLRLCAVGMSTVMCRRELFSELGMFNEGLRCCEDYDLWLRVSCRHPFLLVDKALTVKEGGRDDQVSYQYRVGMDRFRIFSLVELLRSGPLLSQQRAWLLEELQRKCRVYAKGCFKHDRHEEALRYSKLQQWASTTLLCRSDAAVEIPAALLPKPPLSPLKP